jgi:hypothetical protein
VSRYLLFVLSGPTSGEGDEETYNRWYDEVHLPDLKAISSVRTARRYKIVQGHQMPGLEAWPYAAVYEIETDDLGAVMSEMELTLERFSPTYDRSRSANVLALQISGDT